MWQPTPSMLITSFTQATGLLCLGPHNTAFSHWVCSALLSPSSSPTSFTVEIKHFSCCYALLSTFDSFSIFEKQQTQLVFVHHLSGLICDCFGAEWQVIDSASSSPAGSGSYMSFPTSHGVTLIANFLTAVWLTLLSRSAFGTRKCVCLPTSRVQISPIKTCSLTHILIFFVIWWTFLYFHSPDPNYPPPSRFCWFADKVTVVTVDVSESSSCGWWAVISHDAWGQN